MSQSSELPRKGLRVSAFAEFAFDLLTAAVSLADVAADVAVCLDFWSSGRLGFFAVSMAIFGLAQASYAFLFVVAFGSHLSNCRKLVTLFIALPFSQLVPVFTMLESLHLDRVSSGLTRLGLRPTRELSTTVTPSGVDSVWTLVHRKFHAHMGFLVEAIVEAIPQCALQVSAVVLSGEASALALLSILLSLTVIASKGWIAAYSLHRPTFVFNSFAIAADVACLFATSAWAAQRLMHPEDDAPQLANTLGHMLVGMGLAGTVLGVVGGAGATLFSIADDHLKVLQPALNYRVPSVAFNLYLVRILSWVLSLLPCITLLALLRLSLLPLLVFRSLSSEHATRHAFFAPLFAFLQGEDTPPPPAAAPSANALPMAPPSQRPPHSPSAVALESSSSRLDPPAHPPVRIVASIAPSPAWRYVRRLLGLASALCPTFVRSRVRLRRLGRAPPPAVGALIPAPSTWEQRLRVANTLIGLALNESSQLERLLSQRRDSHRRLHNQQSAVNHSSQSVAHAVVLRWVRSLGAIKPARSLGGGGDVGSDRAASAPSPAAAESLLVAWHSSTPVQVAQMRRGRLRWLIAQTAVERNLHRLRTELHNRSEVFRRLVPPPLPPSAANVAAPSVPPKPRSHRCSTCRERALICLALSALVLVVLATLLAVPLLVLLVPFGALFPLMQLTLSLLSGGSADAPALPLLLTAVYASLLLAMLMLLPSVRRFQAIRATLLPTAGLPEAFFCPAIVEEMRRRLAVAQGVRFNSECAVCCERIEGHEGAIVLHRCSHAFHSDCITMWINNYNQTCPLCRGPAALDELVMVPSLD
mmetsp:Transcript_12915/g.29465  ORF Transcript_12915/g.29465 Transcript_12915/m.29465 type:complete len:814 (-) Transcript_12915:176-2617(-)